MRFYIHAHDTLPTRRQIISCHVAVAGAEASTTKFNSYMKSSRADSKSTPGVSDISSSSSSTDEPRPRTHMDIRQKKTSSGRGRALNTQGTMRMKYILGFGGYHHGRRSFSLNPGGIVSCCWCHEPTSDYGSCLEDRQLCDEHVLEHRVRPVVLPLRGPDRHLPVEEVHDLDLQRQQEARQVGT